MESANGMQRVYPALCLANASHVAMPWEIGGQVEEHRRPGVDASGWLWEIRRGEDARRVLVEITGTARAVDQDSLLEETRQAIESEGRSQVERVLSEDTPPTIIQCGTNGCHDEHTAP
jgi:hypothetical protein